MSEIERAQRIRELRWARIGWGRRRRRLGETGPAEEAELGARLPPRRNQRWVARLVQLLRLEVAEDLPRTPKHRFRQPGEAGHVDAIAARRSAGRRQVLTMKMRMGEASPLAARRDR